MINYSDKWVDKFIAECEVVSVENKSEQELAEILVKKCYENKKVSPKGFGRLLASAFDLLVAGEYYASLSHTGWLYCPNKNPRLYFHYTNCCPRHVLNREFYFSPSQKPESGKIGTATAKLLLLFIQELFKRAKRPERVIKGKEPADALIVNDSSKKVLFAEIKASPLLTPALSVPTQKQTQEIDGEAVWREHSSIDFTELFEKKIDIFIPEWKNNKWNERYFELGSRKDAADKFWGFNGIINLLKNNHEFFTEYFKYWNASFEAYHPRSTDPVFWMTNGCGTPSPIPINWPSRRKGGGFESISDSKTSVGMDRTDDLKKGIYQVLKLGSVGKPHTSKWNYKVAIISNIHAARHFDEYLASLKDIVWTLDASGKAKKVSDLHPDQDLYNLFDGLIALTSTLSRDEWITAMFEKIGDVK